MLLDVLNVTKNYSNHRALDGVSMHVPQGVVYGLLGPNGAGKTTLIRLINQITMPDAGEILLNGNKLSRQDIERIGYLPEERGLYKKMKVKEQIIYFAQLKGLNRNEARLRMKDWCDRFEIPHLLDKKVDELSKGMQQKIQIICTLLHNPKLLIFDEPFSGFDPVNAILLKREIHRLKDDGATFILSTHNMNSVEELCSHITLINKSHVVLEGEVEAIRHNNKSDILSVTVDRMPDNLTSEMLEIISSKEIMGKHEYRIRKNPSVSNRDLIRQIAEVSEIYGFTEEMPSMEEIFVKTVSEKEKGENHE
ncbi:MAG: ABC transporter ATP-binding protein [Bacteroidales bacterium]